MYVITVYLDVIKGRFGNIFTHIKLRKVFMPKLLNVTLGPCIDVPHN